MRYSRNSVLVKAKNQAAINQLAELQFSSADNGYPWRDEDDPFFTPLPIDKFLWDFLRVRLYAKQLEDVVALVGADPKLTFEPGTGLPQQAALMHGKGAGKDYLTSCVMIWSMHVLLCLKNPALYLGQAYGENIDVLTVAYSREQATTVLFYKIKARLKACGWFNDAIAKLVPSINPERYLKEGAGFVNNDSIIFPGNIRLWSLPATDAAEGKNPILWCADEIAAFSSPVRMNQAEHIHRLLVSSARTRFQDRWKGLVISFPRHKGDYMCRLIDLAAAGKAPDIYAVTRATWEVNERVTRESLQPDYDRDPEGSACRYECKPPSAIDAYYRSPELICLNASGAPLELLRKHLGRDYSDEQLAALSVKGRSPILKVDQHGDPILDRFAFPQLAQWFQGKKDPRGTPYDYYVHVDIGLKNDAAGFAIAHLEETPTGKFLPVIDVAFRWTAAMFRDRGDVHRKGWFSDTQDQIEVVTAAEIDIRTIREFIFYLKVSRGFEIAIVTFDGFNSAETMQELRKRAFPVGMWTVNKADYDACKSLIYTRQLQYYGYPIFIEESVKLQIINGSKVDAPRTKEGGEGGGATDSHKDVSDAIAAVAARMAFMRDDSLPFEQLPEAEVVMHAKADTDLQINAAPTDMSAAQQQLFSEFFS